MNSADDFDGVMARIAEDFKSGRHRLVCEAVDAWVNVDVKKKPVIPAEQLGWPIYYKAKSLYEMKEFERFSALMNSTDGALVAALGNRNWGYLSSVMMEVCLELRKFDEIPRWVESCLRERVKHAGPDDFRSAVHTSRLLAEKMTDSKAREEIYRVWLKFAEELNLKNLKESALNLLSPRP